MYELTVVPMQQCVVIFNRHTVKGSRGSIYVVELSRSGQHTCTCPAYQFSPMNECKHIDQVIHDNCTWHEQYGEAQDDAQRDGMVCPECGGPTEWVSVAV